MRQGKRFAWGAKSAFTIVLAAMALGCGAAGQPCEGSACVGGASVDGGPSGSVDGGPDPVDSTPPDTSITSGPPAASSSRYAQFSFASSEAAVTYECSLDGAPFAPCGSPVSFGGLEDGAHWLGARAVDAAGNVDPSPATHAWSIDAAAPDAPQILSPTSGSFVSDDTPVVSGTAEAGAAVQVYLDGAPTPLCASPVQSSGGWSCAASAPLLHGVHTVRATARDALGNTSSLSAAITFTVDTVAPQTTIVSGPPSVTASTTALFDFSSNEAATYQCSLDNAVFSPCADPSTFTGLATGNHSLKVRAVDLAGNVDGSPAVHSWSVATGPSWRLKLLTARDNHAMAYDAARQRVVLFGQVEGVADTWEWDGASWTLKSPPTSPPPRGGIAHALVYDAARQRVVLFGGIDESGSLADTWEWDGSSWALKTPAVSPPPRFAHALAYDGSRQRVVLFGGYDDGALFSDTWEWDGTSWIQKSPAAGPAARDNHALTYDAARQRVVLFGGYDGTNRFADTWEWNGTTWAQKSPTAAPPARDFHQMAYDSARQRVLLFGGFNYSAGVIHYADTWEWDGVDWVQRTPATSPSARYRHAAAYDVLRQRFVVYGGQGGGELGDTWEWDGSSWALVQPAQGPTARTGHAMAFDEARQRTVLFGGSAFVADTWEWDGTSWTRRTPAISPPPRHGHAMAYDSARQRVVLFGGYANGRVNDTWEWDGTHWTQRMPSTSPPARDSHAMTYDSARQRVVLYGGYGLNKLGDTWEWDGTEWTERTPAISPGPQDDHDIAYDSGRQRVVLYGSGETWEWDGSNWVRMNPAHSPTARFGVGLAYHAGRQRMILFGGDGTIGLSNLAETWEWNGTDWTQLVTAPPPGRSDPGLVFDSARQRLVLFGGYRYRELGDTWELQ